MQHYASILTLHIIFAGIWSIFFAADIILKKQIRNQTDFDIKSNLYSLYLKFTNLFGIVGSVGIAITGIILVLSNHGYGFFDMSHAHWLATKQIIFVIILIITFAKIIPESKKLRLSITEKDVEKAEQNFNIVAKLNLIVTVMVILNLVFALTHRFYS